MAPQGHVMLSYQWDYQKQVTKIRDALKGLGFKVWMDIDSMRGNIYEKMAEGVEGASVMIVCMSSKYQTSESCTRECQYGQDRKNCIIPIKLESGFNATGALGLITAGKLYIDFSDSSKFNDNMKGLKQEIESQTGKVKKAAEPVQASKPAKKEADKKDGRIDITTNERGDKVRLGSTGKYYCGKRLDGAKCGCCDGGCGPTNGCNCSPCMKVDVKARGLGKGFLVNRAGFPSKASPETGHYYCGRHVMKNVRGCDGYCGPTNGPNCSPCGILETQAKGRYANVWKK